MIDLGLIDEVRSLIKRYGTQAPAFNAIGYKQVIAFLQGETTREDAIRFVKRDSKRYAKRQITWFKKEPHTIWLDHNPDNPQRSLDKLVEILGKRVQFHESN